MMGYAGMGMTVPWLFAGIVVALIWAGVWWMVSTIGVSRPHQPPSAAPARPQLPAPSWQQPDFSRADAADPLAAEPGMPHPQGDLR